MTLKYIMDWTYILKQKLYEKAIANFNKIVNIAPKSSIGYYNLSLAYEYMGDENKAKIYLEKRRNLD